MADRSGGSLAQTRFSSELRATSGAGSGVRAEVSVDPDRSVELPQAASPRQEPQSKAASAAADALMGGLSVILPRERGAVGRALMSSAIL